VLLQKTFQVAFLFFYHYLVPRHRYYIAARNVRTFFMLNNDHVMGVEKDFLRERFLKGALRALLKSFLSGA